MDTHDKISSLLKTKPGPLWSVPPRSTVYDALQLIAGKEVGAVLVMRGSELLGIFSEREYARNVALQGRSSWATDVAEVMQTPPLTISPDASIDDAMHLMTDHRVRYLAVVEGPAVVGIVSIGDLVKWIISVQQRTLDHLHGYITGQYDTMMKHA
jgi:signal-transduction protein with cAMP-binding, CBS, and nucleotidyltransferase domain